jgi:glutamate-ammonia-ligase adenylyltransferase
VVSFSPWLTDLVAGAPLLLDELIDPRIFEVAPELEALEEELDELLEAAPAEDMEARMDALRQFQQASVMRVAVADLSGVMGVMAVSDRLSEIAELVISKALDLATAQLQEKHGTPWCDDGGEARPARFVVVAYGKLGSLELGYGSDLDLVFVHDSTGERAQTHGPKPLENGVFFARLAQRVISILSLPTSGGKLYEVDTRLRPSGSAGLLVTSLSAFARYQAEDAWTWEHQALLRARPVAGDPVLAAAFMQVRDRILARSREPQALRREVAEMRARMQREHARGDGEGFDIKHDRGGLTDIEFLVQYLVLRYANRHPRLRRWTDNMRLLESMMVEGILPVAEGAALGEAFKAYRAVIHRRTLEGKPAVVADEEMAGRQSAVRMIWRMVFPDREAPADPDADG